MFRPIPNIEFFRPSIKHVRVTLVLQWPPTLFCSLHEPDHPRGMDAVPCTSNAVTVTFCAADHSSRVVALPNGTENSTGCPYSSTEYYLCPAYQPVYDLISLITGRGGYNDTWLIFGHYVNFSEYRGIMHKFQCDHILCVVYIGCTAGVYCISFIVLIIRYLVVVILRSYEHVTMLTP